MSNIAPHCFRCRKLATEMPDLIAQAAGEPDYYASADDVARDDGTFNEERGTFACTPCYIALGCPSSPTGWTAP